MIHARALKFLKRRARARTSFLLEGRVEGAEGRDDGLERGGAEARGLQLGHVPARAGAKHASEGREGHTVATRVT